MFETFKWFQSRDKRILTRVYCTYVRPILEYRSPVWSPHSKQLITKIERGQRFFTRAVPGLRTLPCRSRLQKFGLQTLEHRHLIRFMPLSQNITQIHSLHHPQISHFHFISHMWSYPLFTTRKMLHHSLFPHQSRCETLELSAPRFYQFHNP